MNWLVFAGHIDGTEILMGILTAIITLIAGVGIAILISSGILLTAVRIYNQLAKPANQFPETSFSTAFHVVAIQLISQTGFALLAGVLLVAASVNLTMELVVYAVGGIPISLLFSTLVVRTLIGAEFRKSLLVTGIHYSIFATIAMTVFFGIQVFDQEGLEFAESPAAIMKREQIDHQQP